MKVERIEIEKATREQLASFALVMGLDVGTGAKEEIIAQLRTAGYTQPTIGVVMEAPKASRKASGSGDVLQRSEVCVWDGEDNFGIKRARRLVYIQIPNQDRPGGEREVPIGINGTHLFVKRNTPSLVPEEYIESLDHAVETRYDPSSDPEQALSAPRHVQRYPFQRVAIPNDDVLVRPNGKPYQKATPADVAKYKAERAKAEIAEDQRQRDRLKAKGLVA